MPSTTIYHDIIEPIIDKQAEIVTQSIARNRVENLLENLSRHYYRHLQNEDEL